MPKLKTNKSILILLNYEGLPVFKIEVDITEKHVQILFHPSLACSLTGNPDFIQKSDLHSVHILCAYFVFCPGNPRTKYMERNIIPLRNPKSKLTLDKELGPMLGSW